MAEISIILPTFNRLGRLKQVLAGLERQDFPHSRMEIIVISDGSTDGTNAYLQSLETPLPLVLLYSRNEGAAAARNRGLMQAAGEVILFLDDDVVPSPRLVSEHAAWHRQHPDAVVIGPMLTPPDYTPSPWIRWMHERLAEQYQAMVQGDWQPTARQFYTGNASVCKQHLAGCGGFDPTFQRAEDVELAYRLADRGLRFLFNPKAAGYHYEQRSFASWSAIPYAYGRNDITFGRDLGQTWLLEVMGKEFATRHPVHRFLIHLCLDRALLSRLCSRGCRIIGEIGSGVLQRFAFSGIFNLNYYQGAADQLGGRQAFFSLVQGDPSEAALRRRRVRDREKV